MRRLLAWLRAVDKGFDSLTLNPSPRRYVVDKHWEGPMDPFGHPPSECSPGLCGARPGDWREARLRP